MTRRKTQATASPPEPSANGSKPSPKRRSRKKTAAEVLAAVEAAPDIAPPDDPPDYRPGASARTTGRLASEIASEAVTWYVPDLIPRGELTFIVGDPRAGKSTCGAWLCSLAGRAAMLPGYEESIAAALIPRLRANRVRLDRTLILDGRLWSLPHDRQSLTAVLIAHRADLLWIDPIDSYVGETDENDGQGVRGALESLARVAHDAGVTVVVARHPGKASGNICPGSRQWLAVPREVIVLTRFEGPPERRTLRQHKDPYSTGGLPREYTLVGEPGEPKRWSLGQTVDSAEVEVLSVSDSVDRWKIDQGIDLLRRLLATGQQPTKAIYAAAEAERLGDRLMRRAMQRLGVVVRRRQWGTEHASYWWLPGTPDTLDVTDTPPP